MSRIVSHTVTQPSLEVPKVGHRHYAVEYADPAAAWSLVDHARLGGHRCVHLEKHNTVVFLDSDKSDREFDKYLRMFDVRAEPETIMVIGTKIIEFDSSTQAYDDVQCIDAIRKGDVLVIREEQVVGLAWTWPVAVTMLSGSLHHVLEAESVIKDAGWTDEQLQTAYETAMRLDYQPASWIIDALTRRGVLK